LGGQNPRKETLLYAATPFQPRNKKSVLDEEASGIPVHNKKGGEQGQELSGGEESKKGTTLRKSFVVATAPIPVMRGIGPQD